MEPLIFTTIAYWMVGLRASVEAFFLTCVVIVLTANTAAACGNYLTLVVLLSVLLLFKVNFLIGCFFSAAFDSISVAITALIPFDYMLMITGGIFINLE